MTRRWFVHSVNMQFSNFVCLMLKRGQTNRIFTNHAVFNSRQYNIFSDFSLEWIRHFGHIEEIHSLVVFLFYFMLHWHLTQLLHNYQKEKSTFHHNNLMDDFSHFFPIDIAHLFFFVIKTMCSSSGNGLWVILNWIHLLFGLLLKVMIPELVSFTFLLPKSRKEKKKNRRSFMFS